MQNRWEEERSFSHIHQTKLDSFIILNGFLGQAKQCNPKQGHSSPKLTEIDGFRLERPYTGVHKRESHFGN